MLVSIIQSELFKLRKTNAVFLLFVGPIFSFLMGLMMSSPDGMEGVNSWTILFMYNSLSYALLFLPLITGVLAGIICRYEHQAGGWKQLLSLPVTRGNVFFGKYLVLLLLVFIMQLLYLGAMYAAGSIKGFTDPFPISILWKSILGGWVATFPLLALQLWLSIAWKSFAAPFAVNVIFVLPAILAVNSEKFGPFYPWAQTFLMMYVSGNTTDTFYIPWERVLAVVGGSFLVFFIGGYLFFRRKSI